MMVNYWAVLLCAVLAIVIGFIWYGPLFGKKWAEVIGTTADDLAARKEMQKRAMPLYVVQFLLTLFQVWVLAKLISDWGSDMALSGSLWIWAAFIVPIVAGSAMWNNDSSKIAWTRFLIQAGYQLVLFVVFALVLGAWH